MLYKSRVLASIFSFSAECYWQGWITLTCSPEYLFIIILIKRVGLPWQLVTGPVIVTEYTQYIWVCSSMYDTRGRISSHITRIQMDSRGWIRQESTDSRHITWYEKLKSLRESILDSRNFVQEYLCENGFSDSHWNSKPVYHIWLKCYWVYPRQWPKCRIETVYNVFSLVNKISTTTTGFETMDLGTYTRNIKDKQVGL